MSNKKKRIIRNKASNLDMRIKNYVFDNQKLLSKYSLLPSSIVIFPFRKTVPLLSKIAMWILKIQGGIFDFRFNDLKQNKKQ